MGITMTGAVDEIAHNFIVPDGTRMEEHTIVACGDVIIGNGVNLGYGVIGENITVGERTSIEGDVKAHSDIRVDLWSKIHGSVSVEADAYFGEFVSIDGRLSVGGNLDVGSNVKIAEGYTAKGWIVVRNPLPVITFIFLYLLTLLQLGRAEEVERALDELFPEEESFLSGKLMIIPDDAKITLTEIIVPGAAVIQNDCRLFGNIRARSVFIGDRNRIFGSVRTDDDVQIGVGCTIDGKIESKREVIISRGSHIMGDVEAKMVILHETARVDGMIRAPEGVILIRDETVGLKDETLRTYHCFSLLFPEEALPRRGLIDGDALNTGYTNQLFHETARD
ncbi:Polymer-forming cytoskeletal [Candidatus Methanoperedenaceae archaeon GB50]|nr:Polymer-forming cytoskeletal [Candidatus Methanoperedenaceae archaeon GB50]CAD7780463.1 MAG: Polymer-forming cytoskeletal [Candidatus Methanoperedenaceae archaeon GB50]